MRRHRKPRRALVPVDLHGRHAKRSKLPAHLAAAALKRSPRGRPEPRRHRLWSLSSPLEA